jgi:hypothetical protein
VSDRITPEQLTGLEACVEADPGAVEFPALVEALRRSGQLQKAEDVAWRGLECKPGSVAGTVVLALTLLDRGRYDEAHDQLVSRASEFLTSGGLGAAAQAPEQAATADEFAVEVTEGELERAFEVAETDADQVVDADRVAREAIREADLDAPEGVSPALDPVFATRSMAELLERQGDPAGASEIRASLDGGAAEAWPMPGADDHRQRIIATLEGWLVNLRREPR